MTDAYDTLREMLANVPDDAQVYVEELESIVEWPGITAGTFRALLAEIAGFEWGWEQREKAHDAEVATLRAQLATAKRELDAFEPTDLMPMLAEAKREGFVNGAAWGAKNYLFSVKHQAVLANEQASREYPATPSGELCDADCGCPSPEAREVPREVELTVRYIADGGVHTSYVVITPADAKRIVRLAQEAE